MAISGKNPQAFLILLKQPSECFGGLLHVLCRNTLMSAIGNKSRAILRWRSPILPIPTIRIRLIIEKFLLYLVGPVQTAPSAQYPTNIHVLETY